MRLPPRAFPASRALVGWEVALETARRLTLTATGFSLRYTDASVIARVREAAADAWEVAADALEEAGHHSSAEGARRSAAANRHLAKDLRTQRYLVQGGVVQNPGDELATRVFSRGVNDQPGYTTDELHIRLAPLARHIRSELPAQPLRIQGRRLRLFTEEDDEGDLLIAVFDIYGDRRALQRLVRVLETGVGAAERDAAPRQRLHERIRTRVRASRQRR